MGKEMKSHQWIVIVAVLLLAGMVACRIGQPESTPEVIVATLTPVAEVPTTPQRRLPGHPLRRRLPVCRPDLS
jgi:hypothetical protein